MVLPLVSRSLPLRRVVRTFGLAGIISFAAAGSQPVRGAAATGMSAGASTSEVLAAEARQEFIKQNYDKAITLLRRHLRKNPKDYNAWNQLAAAFYQTGLPKRALRYLRSVETKTTERSYNLFYQGLCRLAVNSPARAEKAFTAASKFPDDYGSRATFELAVIDYNAREKDRAKYWLTAYLQKSPNGIYAAQASKMLASLQKGDWIRDAKGADRPDMEKALYKYNSLSLFDTPHYWFITLGSDYITSKAQEPTPGGGLKSHAEVQQGLIIDSGLGIGPYRSGDTTAWAGYNYRQLWLTDDSRLKTWQDEPSDFEYQPFRSDLMERRHQVYGDFRRVFAGRYYLGVFGRLEYARVGSSFFPDPEDKELRKVFRISDTTLFIPWMGASYYKDFRTIVYMYMRKEINADASEFSNMTYSLGGSAGKPTMSLGISHTMDFREINLSTNVELFQYEFIYNDYWLDYTRQGAIVGIEHGVLPQFDVELLLGMYKDKYQLPRIKLGPCEAAPQGTQTTTGATPDETPRECPRNDSGMMYRGGITWNYSQFHRVAASYTFVQNSNTDLKEFEEVKQTILVTFTMAFPSVKRVMRFVDRFADSAFTKEPR